MSATTKSVLLYVLALASAGVGVGVLTLASQGDNILPGLFVGAGLLLARASGKAAT